MLTSNEEIQEFIPQRSPIVMVDALVEADEDHAVTRLFIRPENVFVTDHYFTEPGLVENIAQTAAVHVGYSCKRQNIPIPIGYIAAIKDLKVMGLPPENATIRTEVTVTNKVMDITVVVGRVEWENRLICTCEMRIFAKLNTGV